MTARWRTLAPKSVMAGLLLAFSLPPWGWWPTAFLGAALAYRVTSGHGAVRRAKVGWLVGFGCFIPGLWWSGAFSGVGAFCLIAVEALSMALAAVVVPPIGRRWPAFVAGWTLLEAVRMTWPFGGLPIGGVFLGQANGPFLDVTRLGGPLALTAVVFLGGAGLAELLARRIIVGPGLVVATMTFTVLGVATSNGGPVTNHVTVAAVQGGGHRGVSDLAISRSQVFSAQRRASAFIRNTRLILWPEDVIALDGPLKGSRASQQMAALARRHRATVLAGVTEVVSTSTFRNEVVAWGPTGSIVGSFEKVHRVPFGEFIPARSFFSHFADLSRVPRDAVAGHGSGLLRTPVGPLGVLVSYEVFYADRSRSSVEDGAQLLVVPTNTSSYATSQIPTVEIAAAKIQAVETGRDLVQASPTGYSAVISSDGTVLRESRLGRPQVIKAIVELRRGLTPYDRFGNGPFVLGAVVVLVVGFLGRWRRLGRKHRRQRRKRWLQRTD